MSTERMRRVEEIFAAARDLDAAARGAFLASACGGDESLRREVSSLLDFDDTTLDIAGGIAEVAQEMRAETSPLPGRDCGPWRLLRLLGQGGMGSVYLAERADGAYEMRAAVKILRRGFASELARARFLQERRILARLQHPNIGRLLDAGDLPALVPGEPPQPYLVMEYIDGQPITTYSRTHQLPPRACVELLLPLCGAVAQAHRSLIIHRDLKPANVLVTAAGEPKLLDFGISKMLEEEGVETGSIFTPLTPAYAAPEQLAGEPATTATDVYGLGLLLYEMLTGHPPHDVSGNTLTVMNRRLDASRLTPPSARAGRAADPDLDTIVLQALHPEPGRRYASVDALADDLQRYLRLEPVLARGDSRLYRLRRFARRHWAPLGAAGLAFAGLAAGLAIAVWEARIAQRRFDDVRRLANVFLFDIHDGVSRLPGSTQLREKISSTAVEYLDRLAADAGHDYGLRRELAAGYLRLAQARGALVGSSLGRIEEAYPLVERGLALLHDMPAAELDLARATEASLLMTRGRYRLGRSDGEGGRADLNRAHRLSDAGCRQEPDPAQDCIRRTNATMALAETAAMTRSSDAAALVVRLREESLAAEKYQTPTETESARIRLALVQSKVTSVETGFPAAARELRPWLEKVHRLAAADPPSDRLLRLAHSYYSLYASYLGPGSGPADLVMREDLLRRSLLCAATVLKLDPADRRARLNWAQASGQLGALLSTARPVEAADLLDRAVETSLELVQLAPDQSTYLYSLGEHSLGYMKLLMQLGREDRARELAPRVAPYMNPFFHQGIPPERDDEFVQLTAGAWLAQAAEEAASPRARPLAAQTQERALAYAKARSGSPAAKALAAEMEDILRGTPSPLWDELQTKFPLNSYIQQKRQGRKVLAPAAATAPR